MKNLLGLVVLAIMLSVNQVSAGNWYTGAYGGANWSSFDIDKSWVQSKSDTGYVIGAVVGKKVNSIPGVRFEADLNYRSNDLDTTLCGDPLIVTDETWALLGNAVYDLPVKMLGFTPYALAGVGYGSRTVSVDYTDYSINNSGLVWQVGGGFNTEIADGVAFGVGYRYFDAPDFDIAPMGGFHDPGANHSVIAEIKFAMN